MGQLASQKNVTTVLPEPKILPKEEKILKDHVIETRETVKNLGSNMVNIKTVDIELEDSFPELEFVQLQNISYTPAKTAEISIPTPIKKPLDFSSNINQLE